MKAEIACTLICAGKEYKIQAPAGSPCVDILPVSIDRSQVLGVLLGNEISDLRRRVETHTTVECIGPDHPDYQRLYQQNLCSLFFAAAARKKPDLSWRLGHSVGEALFVESLNAEASAEDIAQIEADMRDMVSRREPFESLLLAYHAADKELRKAGRDDSASLLGHLNPPFVRLLKIAGITVHLVLGPVAVDASALPHFQLLPYHGGVLIRYPSAKDQGPHAPLAEFRDIPMLSRIYEEHRHWSRILGAPNVGRLNQLTDSKQVKDFILIAEALQAGKINSLSEKIAERRGQVGVVLIAGPSSSGKTTFAKRLGIQLQTFGIVPRTISLDDYFVPRDQTPRDEHGEFDFESFKAIDSGLFTENLLDLFAGKEVKLPSYDFKSGSRVYGAEAVRMQEDEVLIIEGIHGLNPGLIPSVPREKVFKIYISALTQINIDEHHRIATTDNRLLRRLIRDHRYRGNHAEATLGMWPSVRRGEDRNIFPYQQEADGEFNSALDYELGVLKPLAESLLREVHPESKAYPTARRLMDLLSLFLPIPREFVPDTSILREFVGGSAFKY